MGVESAVVVAAFLLSGRLGENGFVNGSEAGSTGARIIGIHAQTPSASFFTPKPQPLSCMIIIAASQAALASSINGLLLSAGNTPLRKTAVRESSNLRIHHRLRSLYSCAPNPTGPCDNTSIYFPTGARLSSRPSTLPAPVQAVCGHAEAAGATPTPPRVAGPSPKSERCTRCW